MKSIYIILVYIFSINSFALSIYDSKRDQDFNPVTYYFNGAYDVIQNPYYFSQRNYIDKHKTLFKRMLSPNHSIKKDGGYKKLFVDEFTTSRVVPNIGLHILGGAYDTLYLKQYFDHKEYKYPWAASIALTYLVHFGNEALELTNDNITSHDNLADLFIFDVAAIFLAQNKSLMSFIHNDLQLRTWHLQPMYDFNNKEVANSGLNYIMRPDLFKTDLRPFALIGMQTLGGASYQYKKDENVTLAFGMALTDPLEQKGRFVSALFWDTKDKLNTSLFINGSEDYRVRLNIFPQVFKLKKGHLGLLLGQKKNRHFILGLNYNLPLGLVFNTSGPR